MIGFITGRLGKDAEVETTSGGTKVIKFKVVENEYKNGEETSIWYDCVSFNPFIIEKQIKALKKGSLVNLMGNVSVRATFSKDAKLYLNYDVVTDMVRIINTSTKRDGTQTSTSQEETVTDEVMPTAKLKPTPKPVETPQTQEVSETSSSPAPYVDEENDDELPF